MFNTTQITKLKSKIEVFNGVHHLGSFYKTKGKIELKELESFDIGEVNDGYLVHDMFDAVVYIDASNVYKIKENTTMSKLYREEAGKVTIVPLSGNNYKIKEIVPNTKGKKWIKNTFDTLINVGNGYITKDFTHQGNKKGHFISFDTIVE